MNFVLNNNFFKNYSICFYTSSSLRLIIKVNPAGIIKKVKQHSALNDGYVIATEWRSYFSYQKWSAVYLLPGRI